MFKFIVVLFALIACAAAEPGILAAAPLAYADHAAVVTAPVPVVTATRGQVIARNYNGITAAPVAAPVVARFTAAAPLPIPLTSTHYVAPFAAASLFW